MERFQDKPFVFGIKLVLDIGVILLVVLFFVKAGVLFSQFTQMQTKLCTAEERMDKVETDTSDVKDRMSRVETKVDLLLDIAKKKWQ